MMKVEIEKGATEIDGKLVHMVPLTDKDVNFTLSSLLTPCNCSAEIDESQPIKATANWYHTRDENNQPIKEAHLTCKINWKKKPDCKPCTKREKYKWTYENIIGEANIYGSPGTSGTEAEDFSIGVKSGQPLPDVKKEGIRVKVCVEYEIQCWRELTVDKEVVGYEQTGCSCKGKVCGIVELLKIVKAD